ncbi:hypothetical protein QTP88_000332 [Uroleucon formosanum]
MILSFMDNPFIHIPEDNSFVCITCDFNLKCIIEHDCIDLFADGTFNYAPKYFEQLYTIHGYKNGYYLPLVYFFLFVKSKDTYKKMWIFLQDICIEYTESQFILKKLHVDFKKAAHQAAYEVFENVQLIACQFHLGQSWWRKSFFGLAFLPSHEVADAFAELISVCPNDKVCSEFSDYVFNNYVDDESPFPPNIWAKEPMFDPRTTNAVESFHRTYNSQFYKSHPHIHLVIMVLQETQAETMTKIRSIETDCHKNMSFIEMQKINSNIIPYDEYLRNKNSKDLLKYLLKVGNKYLGMPL